MQKQKCAMKFKTKGMKLFDSVHNILGMEGVQPCGKNMFRPGVQPTTPVIDPVLLAEDCQTQEDAEHLCLAASDDEDNDDNDLDGVSLTQV
jgi:hypothetical protein